MPRVWRPPAAANPPAAPPPPPPPPNGPDPFAFHAANPPPNPRRRRGPRQGVDERLKGISKPAIRRLARRGGVKRISGLIYEEARGVLKVFLENTLRDAVTYCEHARRKTVTAMDIVHALKRQGRTLYGYGGKEGSWSRTRTPEEAENERVEKAARRLAFQAARRGQPVPSNAQFRPQAQAQQAARPAAAAPNAYKLVLVCNSGAAGLTRRMVQALGSRNIFLDSAIYPATIYGYLKTSFKLVATPNVGGRTRAAFLAARTYTIDQALALVGYNPATDFDDDFTEDDKKMLLSALIVKAYFRSNGKSEAQATAKAREWPTSTNAQRTAVRQSYLDIVTRNNTNWRGQFLNDASRALQANGILAAEPGDDDDAVINSDRNYEYYFNASLTMRYDSAPTPFTASESTGTNPGGLPAPITLASLRNCTGSMRGEVEPDNTDSETGVRTELRTIGQFANMRGSRVYTEQVDNGFWVAVGL
jgi:histone H4